MNLDKDNAYWTAKYTLDLKYAEEVLAGAQGDVEKYKNFLENLKYADGIKKFRISKLNWILLMKKRLLLTLPRLENIIQMNIWHW